jgi:hypothetical protein
MGCVSDTENSFGPRISQCLSSSMNGIRTIESFYGDFQCKFFFHRRKIFCIQSTNRISVMNMFEAFLIM